MNCNAFPTGNFICATPETGNEVEFWIDWVPAIDGLPGRALRGELGDGQLLVVPVDDSDLASAAGRIIAPINDEVMEAMGEDAGVFLVLCGPSGVISRTRVQIAGAPA